MKWGDLDFFGKAVLISCLILLGIMALDILVSMILRVIGTCRTRDVFYVAPEPVRVKEPDPKKEPVA